MNGGEHRPANVRPVPYEEAGSKHFNAVDSQGNRYTTHGFAQRGDWHWGARILTPTTVAELQERGELPLREVSS